MVTGKFKHWPRYVNKLNNLQNGLNIITRQKMFFCLFPRRTITGCWVWLETIYLRVIFVRPDLDPPYIKVYYTKQEMILEKLKGDSVYDRRTGV